MSNRRYDPKNPRPGWNPGPMNTILDAIDHQPLWGGITTAWRRPYSRNLAGVEVAFLGIPWDGTPLWRTGQRFMPRAIREASMSHVAKVPFIFSGELKMVDYGDALFHPGNLWDYLDQTEQIAAEILAAGTSIFACGGDHSIPLPVVRAYGKAFGKGLSLIHFDAHSDAYAEILPYPTGGTWVNELTEEGWVDGQRSVTLGVRTDTVELGRADIFHQLDSDAIIERGPAWAAERVLEIVGDNLVYITFDPDFLDASQAPAVHTPEPLGPDMHFTNKLFKHLTGKGLKVIGFDINELTPQYEPPAGLTAMNICTVSNWCLRLLMDGRKSAGLTLDHVGAADG
ncbi:arginase family protein [uncultured Thiodictyon sp.]|jgi:agmatinase|uniref:arginase family protein n=1 Tax=uncultured Thiodictyon sp. TaxID=1846217 RepID=UPI0025F5F708|nr:arginase family protein [uncultured Thiodictyon sp.]